MPSWWEEDRRQTCWRVRRGLKCKRGVGWCRVGMAQKVGVLKGASFGQGWSGFIACGDGELLWTRPGECECLLFLAGRWGRVFRGCGGGNVPSLCWTSHSHSWLNTTSLPPSLFHFIIPSTPPIDRGKDAENHSASLWTGSPAVFSCGSFFAPPWGHKKLNCITNFIPLARPEH